METRSYNSSNNNNNNNNNNSNNNSNTTANTTQGDNLIPSWGDGNDFIPQGWTVCDNGSEVQPGNQDVQTTNAEDDVWYDLHGQKVEQPTRSAEGRLFPKGLKKGLYIHNGKKVFVK
jgi:hypothetical protein